MDELDGVAPVVLITGSSRGIGAATARILSKRAGARKGAADLMRPGGRIVFVTSHQAHFPSTTPVVGTYEAVAQSKRAGEDALRAEAPALAGRGISLVVVSGDMIEGTATVMLLERANPGITDARRGQVGAIPTIEEFAAAVSDAALARHPAGDTIYVGGHDYLTPRQ